MLRFKQFMLESIARAQSAANLNARGTVSEYAVLHSINHYVSAIQQGHSHQQALQSMQSSLPIIHHQTMQTPEVIRDGHTLAPDDISQTIKDSHAAAVDIIHHIHTTVGPISGSAIDTGKMAAHTIEARFGQRSSADLIIPVHGRQHRFYGLSLKYGAKQQKSPAIKLNTPGHGITHNHIQQLHQTVFGHRDEHLDRLWNDFSPKLVSTEHSAESQGILTKLKAAFRAKQPSGKYPPSSSLLRKAGRGVLDDETTSYRFDINQPHLPASTPEGEGVRQAYQQEYAVKSDPSFKQYSSHAHSVLQKVFDHVQATSNPEHTHAIHQFISGITNVPLQEPTIKTELAHIQRGSSTPVKPVHLTGILQQKLSSAGRNFAAAVKGNNISIFSGGKRMFAIGRGDPKRGNPVTSTSFKGE